MKEIPINNRSVLYLYFLLYIPATHRHEHAYPKLEYQMFYKYNKNTQFDRGSKSKPVS